MRNIFLFIIATLISWNGSVFAKQPSFNDIFDSFTKLNSEAVKKTTTTPFKMNCSGTGNNKNGFCEIDMGDAVYFGDTTNSKPNGNGIYYWKNSDTVFVGQFKNGKINGLGVYIWDDSTYFQGKIEDAGNRSVGVIFSNHKERPSIYIGELDSQKIYSRSGYGSHSYFVAGAEPTLNSQPTIMYEAYFLNNISKGKCYVHQKDLMYAGSCVGSSPSEYNFVEDGIRNELFEKNLDRALNDSAQAFDEAGHLANKTYELAFGEKIVDDEKKIIVEDDPKIDLEPVEREYVSLVNANVRAKPYVGADVITTIPAETTVFVPGKVKNTDWFLIELNGKSIGYSYAELYLDKETWLAGKKDRLKEGLNPEPEEPDFFGSGTGFFVTETGYIVTNHHVTHGCEYMLVGDEKLKVVRNDVINDLALLKSEKPSPNFLRISGQITPKKGEDLFVIGFPFGKFASTESKVTRGIVSSLQGLGNNINQFQIDAAIQPGNSGGPVVNTNGSLLGVTVATADYKFYEENFEAMPQNVNFAIKSSLLENFLVSYKVKYETGDVLGALSQSDMIGEVDKATLYMECWSTEARVEEAKRGVNVLVDTVRAEKKKNK